jgi:hypothetical protein
MCVKGERRRRGNPAHFVVVCVDAYGHTIKIGLAMKQRQMDMSEQVLSTMGKARLRVRFVRINQERRDVQKVLQIAVINAALDVGTVKVTLPVNHTPPRLKLAHDLNFCSSPLVRPHQRHTAHKII